MIARFATYVIGAATTLAWIEPGWFGGAAALLCGLLALRDFQTWSDESGLGLALDPKRDKIALERAGQPYFFAKYKVYPTRWFAILKLIDKQQNRTLFLTPDRFESLRNYRECRFVLRRMESGRAA